MHIDYANRKESGHEADFLEDWCRDEVMVFRKRTVSEVKRGVTNREEYEEVARMARYEAYLDTMKEFGCEVVLNGHHHGDVQENVISNIMMVSRKMHALYIMLLYNTASNHVEVPWIHICV